MTDEVPLEATVDLLGPKADHHLLLCTMAIGVSAAVNSVILGIYFHADDFLNLLHIRTRPLVEYLLTPFGGHLCLFRNLLFLCSFALFGLRSEAFFMVVLLTHLLNVRLLFRAVQQLSGSDHLAAFGATLWGVLPLNGASLGWFSVYGHVVAGTVSLTLLGSMAQRWTTGLPLSTRTAVSWYGLLLLGSVSFGTGIGLALVFPIVFAVGFPRASLRAKVLFCSLPPLVGGMWIGLDWLARTAWGAGPNAGFLVAMAMYWMNGVRMLWTLTAYGVTATVSGCVSEGAMYPYWMGCVILGMLVLAIVSVLAMPSRRVSRETLLSVLVLLLGAYGMIALGRGSLMANQPINGAEFGRYHYVASALIVLVLCLVLTWMGEVMPRAVRWGELGLAGFLAVAVVHSARAMSSLPQYSDVRTQTLRVVDTVRRAAAEVPPGGVVVLGNRPFATGLPMVDPAIGGWAGVFVIAFPDDVVDGHRVRFVEPDPKMQGQERPGSRLANLFVGPAAASPSQVAPSP